MKQKTEKSKLFPSKEIEGMLTDGQGGYYPDDKAKKGEIEKQIKEINDIIQKDVKWNYNRGYQTGLQKALEIIEKLSFISEKGNKLVNARELTQKLNQEKEK